MKNRIISINKFSQIPLLSFKKIIFNVSNFDLKDLSVNDLSKISLYEKLLIERTEEKMIMNIEFTQNSLDLYKSKSIRPFEDVAWFFYNQSLLTKYINSKDFIISLPQLFASENIKKYDHLENDLKDCEAVFIYNIYNNNLNTNSVIERKSNECPFSNYLNENNIKNNTCKLFDINSIEPDVKLLKRKIKLPKFEIIEPSNYKDIKLQNYNKVAFGGSFDHMHVGHNLLLTTAALSCKNKLYIGITGDKMLKKKEDLNNAFLLQPFEFRKRQVINTIRTIGFKNEIIIKKIEDTLGGTGTDEELDALVVTEETLNGGLLVNTVRRNNKIKEVDLLIARLVFYKGQMTVENKISSSKIRQGIKDDAHNIHFSYLRWLKLITEDLNLSKEFAEIYFCKLLNYYSQFWRKYHTFDHIYKMLIMVDECKFKDNLSKNKYLEFLLAIWFHDIIYVPSRNDNEDVNIVILIIICFREV